METETQVIETENTELTEVEVDAAFGEGAASETEGADVAPVGAINDKEVQKDAGRDDTIGGVGDGGADAGTGEAGQVQGTSAEGQEAGGEEKEPTLAELQADNERLTKEAGDNQVYGRAESEKNAALKKELAELKAGQQEKVDPMADAPDDVKEYLADNPEVQTVVEKLANHLMSQQLGGLDPAQISEQLAAVNSTSEQMRFDHALSVGYMDEKGTHIQGHPDAIPIIHSTEFKAFVETEKANTESISAADAINLITKFKTAKAAAAATEHDKGKGAKDRKQAQDYSGAAGGSLGKGNKEGTGKGKSDDNKSGEDYFNEGAAEEEKVLQ